jgi:ribosome-associated protein
MTGEQTAQLCAKYADDKKAEDIVIIDVRGLSPITDYFVICTASSSPHLRAIQSEIDEWMHTNHGQAPYWRDDNFDSQWLILDYSDVMVHIFQDEKRAFYSLEELWGDGKPVEVNLESATVVANAAIDALSEAKAKARAELEAADLAEVAARLKAMAEAEAEAEAEAHVEAES